jgi:hypothetical protein
MRVAQALADNFGGGTAAPHQIALALDVSPTSSSWRYLTGAAVAYGLTTGAYNANSIGLTPLGRRCVAPTVEGDDLVARKEAVLKPSGIKQFLMRYHRAKFPMDKIAKNLLEHDLGVPKDRLDACFAMVRDNAEFVGFIQQTKTGPYVSVDLEEGAVKPASETVADVEDVSSLVDVIQEIKPPPVTPSDPKTFKVFISHGKNLGVVSQVKDILSLYDIPFEVAVEEESPAIPVPKKVTDAMRRCQAGIMVVTADCISDAGVTPINDNVLIEIGAAFVLYDQKVILLWDKRLQVPSNLQGLYRCEFEGTELSFATGTKLAKAVKSFRDK